MTGRFARLHRAPRPLTDSERFGFYAGVALLLFAVGLFVQGMAPGWLFQAGVAAGVLLVHATRWAERRDG